MEPVSNQINKEAEDKSIFTGNYTKQPFKMEV